MTDSKPTPDPPHVTAIQVRRGGVAGVDRSSTAWTRRGYPAHKAVLGVDNAEYAKPGPTVRSAPNRTFPRYWLTFIDCPYCGREHVHGDGAGHRVVHCSGPGTTGGYVIDYPAGWKDRS